MTYPSDRFRVHLAVLFAASLTTGPAAAAPLTFDFLKIAETGDVAPGSIDAFDGDFSDPSVDDQGNVAFHADVANNPGFTEGTYAYIGGSLIRIMDEANPLPGLAVTINSLDDHVEIRNGTAAFFGDIVPNTSFDGLAISDGTTSRVIAQEGSTVLPSAGSPVVDSLRDSEGFGFDGTRVAFSARYATGQGVYLDDGTGTLTKLADTDDTAPNTEAFTFFDNAMPDANGPGVVFTAATATTDDTIYLSNGGVLTEVAAAADVVPVSTGIDDIRLGEPDIDAGRVAFTTRQLDFSGPIGTPGASVELWDNGTITTIADQTTLLPGGGTAIDFAEVGIAGDFVAFATQTDPAGSGQDAMYVWSDGMINKVLAVGDTLDGLTVTGIESYNRPFLADGFLAMQLDLSDGSTAIYRVEIIPEPASLVLMGLGGMTLLVRCRNRRAN